MASFNKVLKEEKNRTKKIQSGIQSLCIFTTLFDIKIRVFEKDKRTKIPAMLFCGSNPEAFRKACEFIKKLSGVKVEKLYDAVIVSPGGYPRDIDLYQAQKALSVAEAFCRPGGTIILTAECKAGYGENTYIKLLKDAESPEALINTFDFTHFKVGPHKAYLLARTLSRYEVRIVSSLPHEELKTIFFTPYQTLEEALRNIPESANVLVIPNSSQIIPLKEN